MQIHYNHAEEFFKNNFFNLRKNNFQKENLEGLSSTNSLTESDTCPIFISSNSLSEICGSGKMSLLRFFSCFSPNIDSGRSSFLKKVKLTIILG